MKDTEGIHLGQEMVAIGTIITTGPESEEKEMKIEMFRQVIQERTKCHDEWTYGIEQCWKKEIELLTEDISSTVDFLLNECSADEYSWISEVIDDVAAITQSRELIACYKSLMVKFPEECKRYNIAGSIECAEATLLGISEEGKERKVVI